MKVRTLRADEIGGRHARYALGVLVVVYIFNFVDRQILAILAEDVKADLGVSDAQIGFLFGTAFSVFYALFGIPLARLSDVWYRTRVIAIGLAFWSLMTALSGLARNFTSLALLRFGVGIGEASAGPAANSLLADYFPPRVRATVLSIYCSGISIGSGIGIFLGGAILDGWAALYPNPETALGGLKGWQVAFFAVGLPGIFLSIIVARLREPQRGGSDGVTAQNHPTPFRETGRSLLAILPPLTIIGLYQAGGTARDFALNFGAAIVITLIAWSLTAWVGEPVQWIALGIGLYGACSWAQSLARRDPSAFRLTLGSPAFVLTTVGMATISFVTVGVGFWIVPFFIREHAVSATEVGIIVGLGTAIGGWAGMTFGGVFADWLHTRTHGAAHIVAMISAALSIPIVLALLGTDSLWVAYVFSFAFTTIAPMWAGPGNKAVMELVEPRMRAVAISLHYFVGTFIGFAMGPFVVGRLSDSLIAKGADAAEGLRESMLLCGTLMLAISLAVLWMARSRLGRRPSGEVNSL